MTTHDTRFFLFGPGEKPGEVAQTARLTRVSLTTFHVLELSNEPFWRKATRNGKVSFVDALQEAFRNDEVVLVGVRSSLFADGAVVYATSEIKVTTPPESPYHWYLRQQYGFGQPVPPLFRGEVPLLLEMKKVDFDAVYTQPVEDVFMNDVQSRLFSSIPQTSVGVLASSVLGPLVPTRVTATSPPSAPSRWAALGVKLKAFWS